MYRIYLNGDLIYAPGSEDLVVIDPQLELELNSPGEFTFTIPQHNPYYNSPVKMISRVKVKRNDETIFYGRIIDETIDFWKNKKLTCEGELAYLNDSIQRPAEYHDLTVREYLETLIEEHNGQVDEDKQFTVGIVTVEDSNDSLYRYTNYNSTMEELKDDLIDDLGGYLRVRYQEGVRYLDYVNAVDYGITNDDAIRFGRNLLDFTQNMDVTDIATVIIPLGERLEESPIEALDMRLTIESVNGGKDWIQSDEAVELYGRIVKTVVWDGVTQADNLLSKGEKYLSDTQWDQAELTVSAIDLNMADKDLDAFHLGDQLRVVSDPHGLDRYFPLSKMDLDLDEPQNNSYTLGLSTSPSLLSQLITQTDLSNQLGSMNARSSSITNAKIDEAKTSVLDEAIENATIIINNKTANGHVVLDSPYEEILIMDTDNKDTALRVWRWNVNGLGYSTTGYSGPYGLAMTMDGSIVADYITTGTLNADLVRTGVIKALSGDNYWDMDSGEMKIGGWMVGSSFLYNNLTGPDDIADYKSGSYIGNDGVAFSTYLSSSTSLRMRNAMSLSVNGLELHYSENSVNDSDAVIQIDGTQAWVRIDMKEVEDFGEGNIDYSSVGRTIIRTNEINLYDTTGSCWLETSNSRKSIYANGSYLTSSDMALKCNVSDLPSSYDILFDALNPKIYQFKNDSENENHIGFVYQDVVEALEEADIDPADSALVEEVEVGAEKQETVGAIAYNEIIALLVSEVQALKAKVKELEEKVT